jgi:hypothetical protein
MNSDGVRSVRPASISLQIRPIHGARRQGFSMANRRSDEISALAQSRTGLREPMKGEPRASGHGRSRNVIENKASCKNVMRIPTMNRKLDRLRFGVPHRGWRRNLGSKLECHLESVIDELRFHPSTAIHDLEPAADSRSWDAVQTEPLPAIRYVGIAPASWRRGHQFIARDCDGCAGLLCRKLSLDTEPRVDDGWMSRA